MVSGTVQGKMARGALWLMLLTLVDRGLGLLSTLILARLLAPADFGIVAMALSFVFLAQLLAAFGFDVALIHKQDAGEAHYHSAWTLNLLLGVAITLVSLAAARPIAIFYHQPAVFWVLCALALGPLIGGCENIGVVTFRKDLEFRKEFNFQLSRRFIGSAVTLPLAFYLRDYWALVAGTLAARLAGTITSYRVHPFRPRWSLTEVASLMKFSKWMLLSNILGVLRERMSDFFLGRLAGATALGIYNVSYEFANLPTSEIGAPVNRALLPGFAKLTEKSAVLAAYTNSMSMVALIAIPVAAGILAVAHFFIPVVLGLRWISGVPLMEVMAVGSLMMVFQSSISAVLLGRGYPDIITQLNFVFVLLLAALMLLLVPLFGALGAAQAFSLTTTLTMPLYLYHLRRLLGMPVKTFLLAVARPLTSSIVMLVCIRGLLPQYSPMMGAPHAALWLLLGVTCGVVIYTAIALILWFLAGKPAGAERALLDQVSARLARLVPGRQSKSKPRWLIIVANVRHNLTLRCKLTLGQLESDIGATHAGLSTEQSIEYINRVFFDYLRYGNLSPAQLVGKRILELGPGDNLGVALRFFAAGAAHVVCLDKLHSRRDSAQQLAIYQSLRKCLSLDERARYDEAIRLEGDVQINPSCVQYLWGICAEDADRVLAPGSFDLIVSRAVLWEIYEVERALQVLNRVLRPAGAMIHKIACLDWMFRQEGYHPLEFLTVPELLYRWMARDSGKSNRRTIDDYRTAMSRMGYDATFHITRVVNMSGAEFPPGTTTLAPGVHYDQNTLSLLREIRPRLLSKYRNLRDQDLMVEDMFLVAVKPA